MQVEVLFTGKACDVVGVRSSGECPAKDFVWSGEANLEGSRKGLRQVLQILAEDGLSAVTPWIRLVNATHQIYEFKKGDLRLFFFRGHERQVAVCTSGVLKKGQKADVKAVEHAARQRHEYRKAVAGNNLGTVN
jgi:hypothetical protein